jgi:hypothetical protein
VTLVIFLAYFPHVPTAGWTLFGHSELVEKAILRPSLQGEL